MEYAGVQKASAYKRAKTCEAKLLEMQRWLSCVVHQLHFGACWHEITMCWFTPYISLDIALQQEWVAVSETASRPEFKDYEFRQK